MKKFISLFLVMTIIIANINMPISYALSNNSNEVKVENNTISQTDEEKTDELTGQDDSSEAINLNNNEDESSNANKLDSTDDTDTIDDQKVLNETSNVNDNSSTYSNQAITVSDNNISRQFSNLNSAMSSIKSNTFSGNTVTIKFNENYTFTDQDATSMAYTFNNNRLIFTANPNATVKITKGFTIYGDDPYYQPSYDSAKTVTFEKIKLEFTGEHIIYANGLWLHMGKDVQMVGNYYPILYALSDNYIWTITGNNNIYSSNQVRMFIESGDYSKISISPKGGRYAESSCYIYFFGGHTKEIMRPDGSAQDRPMKVQLFGGSIDLIKNYESRPLNKKIEIEVGNTSIVGSLENIFEIAIGANYGSIQGHLVINGTTKEIQTLGLYGGSILEVGEHGKFDANSVWTREGVPIIRVPPNRDKDNVPIILHGMTADPDVNNISLELTKNSTDKEQFYLMKVDAYGAQIPREKFKISEDEFFYLDQIEHYSDGDYLRAKMKVKGPLSYNTETNKFSYVDEIEKKEKEAWWIKPTIKEENGTKTIELNYDNIAKDNLNYVLAPSDITLDVKGNVNNQIFKFNNDRSSDRKFNIVLNNLNATDSGFVFENIKSLTVEGKNSISNQNSTKTALKYSFSGNESEPLKFNNNGSFTVYNKEKNTINNNIVNSGTSGNDSIVNISFEDDITSKRNFKLEPRDTNLSSKTFSTLSGYNVVSMLFAGDDKEYLLKEVDDDRPYYYQSARSNVKVGQINGPIGTKIILTKKDNKQYHNVNNKNRVYIIATQNNRKDYYLSDSIKNAMETYVAHQGGSHEIAFLGNYDLSTTDDSNAIKHHNKNTTGITFTTKVDDFTYSLTVGVDIEFSDAKRVPVTFKDIKLNYKSNDKWIYGNGRTLTFAENVVMEGNNYPSISAGQSERNKNTNSKIDNSNIIIHSGTYKDVTGDRYNTLQNATIVIHNGTFKGNVSGVSNDTNDSSGVARINDATLTIHNGIFEGKVYGVKTDATANGSLNMTINGGIFKSDVIGVSGAVNSGNATLVINNGTFNSKVAGADIGSEIKQTLNMTIHTGTFKNKVVGVNGGTVNNATLTVNNGTFESFLFGTSLDTTRDKFNLKSLFNGELFRKNGRTTLTGSLNMIIKDGTFRNQVHGANSASNSVNVTLQILGGNFNHNIVGTQVSGSTLVMTVNGGTFNAEVVGQYSGKANSVTLNITNGTFKGNVRGADDSNKTTLNVSGGTFNVNLVGDRSTRSDNATININGNITVPIVMHYDELVVGEKSKSVLTITDKIEANGVQDDNLIIKNSSEVILSSTNKSEVNKLTIEGAGNSLKLNLGNTEEALTVKSDYNTNNQKLTLHVSGQIADKEKLILFKTRKVDINNFIFNYQGYYIKPINNNNGNEINIYSKVLPNKLIFRLDLSQSTLKYSLDGSTFEDVWWYKYNLSEADINLTKEKLLEYEGNTPFKDIDRIQAGNKVFELVNTGSNKTITFDLGQNNNFDFKLDNVKLDQSRLDLKNLRNLILSRSNSISQKTSDTQPTFRYQISGDVVTENNSSLSVYTNSSNEGIQSVNNSGYGAKLIFENRFSENKELKLKEVDNNNGVQLSVPNGCEKISLLLPRSFTSKNLNLVDNTNQNLKYYFGDVVNNSSNGVFGYNISIDKQLREYKKVNNVPFIAISKNGNFIESKKNMQDVINYINSDNNKLTSDYTLTFMHNYELNSSELQLCKEIQGIQSLNVTTNYTPLNQRYVLAIDDNLNLSGESYITTFNNIDLNFKNPNLWIYANGQSLIMGSDVRIVGNNKPSISGGKKNVIFRNSIIPSATIEIRSGNYKSIVGSTSPVTGNVNVIVSGSTNVEDSIKGCKSTVDGNVFVNLKNNVNTNSIIGTEGPVKGNVEVKVEVTDESNVVDSVIGTTANVDGNVKVVVREKVKTNSVIGSSASSVGSINMEIRDTVNTKSVIGSEGPVTGAVNIIVVDSAKITEYIKGSTGNSVGSINIETTSTSTVKSVIGSEGPVTGDVNVTVRGTSTVNSVTGSKSRVEGKVIIIFGDSAKITDSIVGSRIEANNSNITINKSLAINEITDFDNLIIGKTEPVHLSNLTKLDKGLSTGNLHLNRDNKIYFEDGADTARLNNIVLDGANNTLVLPRKTTSAPVELSGTIETKNNKLNIELLNSNTTNDDGLHLIKFNSIDNADVQDKYNLPSGYYVREMKNLLSTSADVILYKKTAFDLEYNFADRKLYKLENGQKSEAWWYTTPQGRVTLTSDQLYQYKGYDLFKDPNNDVERNITLTGSNSNQLFGIDNSLNHVNVILDNINLTNSRIAVLGIKSLKLIGANTINSIDQNDNIFVSEFQSGIKGNNVLFGSDDSYLKVFAKESINPFRFDGKASGTCMDFKFFKSFDSNSEVRLNDNAGHELKFNVPNGTQRLGILLKNSNSNKPYNLYHGESGNTGSSVYVCGNTQDTFKECFEISSNNIVSYNYVRRANPVNIFNGKVSDQISFSLDTTSSGLDGIKPDNWEQYFNATDMIIENNNSRIVKDQFTDEHGVTHYFGEKNADLELGYMGVSPSENSSNDIKLVSKDEIDSNITNSSDGIKLALKFLDESCKANLDGSSCKVHLDGSCQVPIDETESTTGPLKEWTIPSNSLKTLKIIPDFNTNNIFFNMNMNSPAMLNSSHKFTFRFGLQKP